MICIQSNKVELQSNGIAYVFFKLPCTKLVNIQRLPSSTCQRTIHYDHYTWGIKISFEFLQHIDHRQKVWMDQGLVFSYVYDDNRHNINSSPLDKMAAISQTTFSNHQPHDCLIHRLYKRRSKKTSKLRVTGLCAGSSPVTGEFLAQMASNTENVSIWWSHHMYVCYFNKYKQQKTHTDGHTLCTTSKPDQNGSRFTDAILKLMKLFVRWFKFHWRLSYGSSLH